MGCVGSFPVCNAGGRHLDAQKKKCRMESYHLAGMQQLLNAVRTSGAHQPVMVGGLDWASDLCDTARPNSSEATCLWLKYEPRDSEHQVIASFHAYNFTPCDLPSCWNSNVARLARTVPVVTGELGEKNCSNSYVDAYMKWADSRGLSYLLWSWQPSSKKMSCGISNLRLLSNWTGSVNPANPAASTFKGHLAEVFSRGLLGK